MRISTTTRFLDDIYGKETAIRMIARAGFDCVDLSMLDMETGNKSPFMQADYREYAIKILQIAQDSGLVINQAHAPCAMDMQAWEYDTEKWEDILFRIRRSIEVAGAVGAEHIVVHPVQYMDYWNTDHKKILCKNQEFYRLLIPTAQKAGIKICIENMWKTDKSAQVIRGSVCSSPYELAEYVDTLNQDADIFCACLDVGHCEISGHNPVHTIHVLGARLQALHIHDTNFVRDLHTAPLTASTNQYAIAEALRECGYHGDYTLEAYAFLKPFRKEFHQEALNFMAKVSRHLADFADEKKQYFPPK